MLDVHGTYLFIYLFIYNNRLESLDKPNSENTKLKGCPLHQNKNKQKNTQGQGQVEWRNKRGPNEMEENKKGNLVYTRWRRTADLKTGREVHLTISSGR